MANESSPSPNTLFRLLDSWNRGELTLEEVVQRWPPADTPCEEATRELLRLILALHARIAAIDGIGDW